MDPFNDVTDEEFVSFLNGLGVETYKRSFEWMLHDDPDFAGILRWLYNNLDHNNALDAREEYRYTELRKAGALLPPEELESTIQSICKEHQGIPLPGDQESLEDVKLDAELMKERLKFLEMQESTLKDMIRQNELSNKQFTTEITELNSAISQYKEEESSASKECLTLAEDVEKMTASVIDVVSSTLDVYVKCPTDKETSQKFLAFGPFESYRQAQALFRSHFDLYTAKKFDKKQYDNTISETELKNALIEANNLEERLLYAIHSYIESKTDLAGERAKLTLALNYDDVHPSQVFMAMEAKSATELCEQEEAILDEQISAAAKKLVEGRSRLQLDTAIRAAYSVRLELHRSLSFLEDVTRSAFTLDSYLYYALRHEVRMLQDVVQLASDLWEYGQEERNAARDRIESMNKINMEQTKCIQKLETDDTLLNTLQTLLGTTDNNAMTFVKAEADLRSDLKEIREKIVDGFQRKEDALRAFKQSSQPVLSRLYDGATVQPNCWDRSVASLTRQLNELMGELNKSVLDASQAFTTVKKGDKQDLRKLWQWFLTDPERLLSCIKATQAKSYS